MRSVAFFFFVVIGSFFTAGITWAQSTEPHIHDELENLKRRMEAVERDTDRRIILGEEARLEAEAERFPIQTLSKTKVDGGVTLIVQGGLNNEEAFSGDRAEASLSVDLILESEIRNNGTVIVRGSFNRGDGLTRLPQFFAGPNGNPTGPNGDIEGFSGGGDSFHLNEALYEQSWEEGRYRFSIGHIDLTSYFDQNEFANSETDQFLANIFVNSVAIEWGGNENFYGPGVVLHYHPVELIEFTIGFFEGDGNYEDTFDRPFSIAEFKLEPYVGKLEGHYRFLVWSRKTEHPLIRDPSLESDNSGFGLSFDQELSEQVGVWARFGIQNGEVAEFDRHVSAGVHLKDLLGDRQDALGLAFGASMIGSEYEQSTGLNKNEYYGELYYYFPVNGNLAISPDIQLIVNPGGNGAIDNVYVYGLRGQMIF